MTTENVATAAAVIALVAAAAAWAALFVQRRNATDTINAHVNIGARNSRASVVSANRQRWIDAIRDDLSDFIATRSQIVVLKHAGSFQGAAQDALLSEERQLRTKLLMLRARIDMRLNHEEKDHLALMSALARYEQEASHEADVDLRAKGRAIFRAEWTRLKKEASGLDPFVKEAIPPR